MIIRVTGIKAVHEPNYGSINEAKRILKLAFFLEGWLKQIYDDWNYELPEFKEPKMVDETKKQKKTTDSHPISNITNSLSGLTMTFSNNDSEYERWLITHNQGFVFNYFGGGQGSREMNKVHSASCRILYRKQDEGKRTTTFSKICSTNLSELEKHITNLRGNSWVYCKSCLNK
ncbi:hypothetical protein AA0X95_16865 [Bacillus sp. 1P10SD]|uniref:hypothetical protein n=1 Tax=Bacillus sp. 1P10SD TaxID=3132265 RepID=UPI0039A6335B